MSMAIRLPKAKAKVPRSDIGTDGYMSNLNTTPLIDVMLVLLIMFIITVPANSHAIKFDLPSEGEPVAHILEKNLITVRHDDQIYWNGKPVNVVQLAYLLKAIGRQPSDQPEVHFRPAPTARYGRVSQILKSIKLANLTRFGFAGNERYRNFGN